MSLETYTAAKKELEDALTFWVNAALELHPGTPIPELLEAVHNTASGVVETILKHKEDT